MGIVVLIMELWLCSYVVVVVVMDDCGETSGKVIDMLVFVYNWYGWYLLWLVGGPSITSFIIEYCCVGG